MIYFDSAYIAKCYVREHGTDAVLDLAETSAGRASVVIAATEVQAAFHRCWRENSFDQATYLAISRRFEQDQVSGHWHWIPVTEGLVRRTVVAFQSLPPDIFLRSADCLHLCAAAEGGFKEIYSNDRRLLAAAPHFGLQPVDVIP